jgi:hypothetical protein
MKEYTQAELDELITCPKEITEPPRRELRLEGSQRRNDMRLRSQGGDREYRVFMRMHDDFTENFSIGLVYLPKDGNGELVLLRCNGPHGEYNANFDPQHPHAEFHVHRASEDAIRAGFRPEKRADRTEHYASYSEALSYFLQEVNIVNAGPYFPDDRQTSLAFEEREPGQ